MIVTQLFTGLLCTFTQIVHNVYRYVAKLTQKSHLNMRWLIDS